MDAGVSDGPAMYISGTWIGERTAANGETGKGDLFWSLSLTNGAFPSAFGASREELQSECTNYLHGTWDGASRQFSLQEHSSGEIVCLYSGVLVVDSDGTRLTGRFSSVSGSSGAFAVLLAPPSSGAAGLWLGRAEPDPSLAGEIPVNPVRWCLSAFVEEGVVFGSGFFDDAADIPGQPVLFFSLVGTIAGQNVTLSKKYMGVESVMAGCEVTYTGMLREDARGGYEFDGKWDNPMGESWGSFSCRLDECAGASAHSVLCAACHRAIDGEAWECPQCPAPWICCGTCKVSSAHEHEGLLPEPVYPLLTADAVGSGAVVLKAMSLFEERPFLAVKDSRGEFQWTTYGDIGRRVRAVVAGLLSKNISSGDRCLLFADISVEYTVGLLAALVAGMVVVPVHGALEASALGAILARTTPAVCVVGPPYVEKFREALSEEMSLCVLSIDCDESCVFPNLTTMSGELPRGFAPRTHDLEDLVAILYTSGSTGDPKGAMYPERLVAPTPGVATYQPFVRLDFQRFHPSYLVSLLQTLYCGGRRVLANLGTLLDDIRRTRPTHLSAPPALWTSLYRDFVLRCQEEQRRGCSRSEAEATTAASMRAMLGNRVAVAVCGGAPLLENVAAFVRKHLRLPLMDLYGAREAGGIARDGEVYEGVDVHVHPLPEFGFSGTKGEICVNSARMIAGYYGDTQKTANAFVTVDGKRFYRTGDVGEVTRRGGKTLIRLEDRVSGFLKLAHGEWVAPGKIETALEASPLVEQIVVIGIPGEDFLVAVVVPSPALHGFKAGTCELSECCDTVLASLRFWGTHAHLRPIEIPKAVHLEREAWTAAAGLMTPTDKKKHLALSSKYRRVCTAIYERHRQEGTHTPVAAAVRDISPAFADILQEVLGTAGLSGSSKLTEVGSDSLTALRLQDTIMRRCGVHVPLSSLFEYTLIHLAELVEEGAMFCPEVPVVNWESEVATIIARATALTASSPQTHNGIPVPATKDGVFITGSTGFFGPCLVAEVFARHPHGPVYCLVRAHGNPRAQERLDKAMQMAGLWEHGMRARLVAVPGNLASAHLGLGPEAYDTLVQNVGFVYHSGAWVNHVLPYSALYDANVAGTLAVVEVASRASARVCYVSSLAAAPGGKEEIREMSQSSMCKMGGYGQTKAVSEMIVRRVAEAAGLDACIVRLSAVCGHRKTGHSNPKDLANMLLQVCQQTCTLPPAANLTGGEALCLGWVPADFAAGAIVAIAKLDADMRKDLVYHVAGRGPLLMDVFTVMIPATTAVSTEEEWVRVVKEVELDQPAMRDSLLRVPLPTSAQMERVRTDVAEAALLEAGLNWDTEVSSVNMQDFASKLSL